MSAKNIKSFLCLFVLLFGSPALFAQQPKVNIVKFYEPSFLETDLYKKDDFRRYANRDFSLLWRNSQKPEYLGFIGDNYRRIRIKLFSVTKDRKNRQTYLVKGKSALDNEIKSFQGTFVVRQIRRLKKMHFGLDEELKDAGMKAQGVLIGEYKLFQDRNLENAGYFEGTLSALWYIDKNGAIRFDDIEADFSDPFKNNLFVGFWKSYDGKQRLKSNWGDYRIPESGDLDIGAAEFSPDKKYLKNGWESYSRFAANGEKEIFDWND